MIRSNMASEHDDDDDDDDDTRFARAPSIAIVGGRVA